MHEFELINKFFSKLTKKNKGSFSLNDDIFFDKSKNLAVSVDTYVEGIHFIDFKHPYLLIKKILRSSISDLICKGVKPKYYFISASGNKKYFSSKNLEKISRSLNEEQKKYSIYLCGGDTVYSNKLSFTITSIGFSKKVILRNKAQINDDIYVTGVLGDSYLGLKILQNKIKLKKKLKEYFIKRYYLPDIKLDLSTKLLNFANTSIDISDGLFSDLEKLINNQKFSYKIYFDKIPVSKNLKSILSLKKLKKLNFISQGDDYQVLFTASPNKSRIISKTAKLLSIKIYKIGKITPKKEISEIIDEKGMKISAKYKGYYHQF